MNQVIRGIKVKPKLNVQNRHIMIMYAEAARTIYNDVVQKFKEDYKYYKLEKELEELEDIIVPSEESKQKIEEIQKELKSKPEPLDFKVKKVNRYVQDQILPKYPSMKKFVYSKTIQDAGYQALTAMKRFLKGLSGFPRFKSWKYTQSFKYSQIPLHHLMVRGKNGTIRLPTPHKVPPIFLLLRGFRPEYPILKIVETVVKLFPDGHIMVSMSFYTKVKPRVPSKIEVIGVDVGIKKTAVLSNGIMFPRLQIDHIFQEIKLIQRKLDKYKNTRLRLGYRRNLRNRYVKLWRRVTAIRRDHINQIVNELSKYLVVIVEDLNLKEMTKSTKGTVDKPNPKSKVERNIHRDFLNHTPGMFFRVLEERKGTLGIIVRKVSPVNTSRRCNECGYIAKNNRNREVFKCKKCGHRDDADLNAAKNIRDISGVKITLGEDGKYTVNV